MLCGQMCPTSEGGLSDWIMLRLRDTLDPVPTFRSAVEIGVIN